MQTVERQGSLVFCVSKSSAAERERVEPLERKEHVCRECPTQMLILMENLGSTNYEILPRSFYTVSTMRNQTFIAPDKYESMKNSA
jgi:hypothetical protein